MTFGPMGDMVKGDIEWNGEQFAAWASDLAAVSSVTVERGLRPEATREKHAPSPKSGTTKLTLKRS